MKGDEIPRETNTYLVIDHSMADEMRCVELDCVAMKMRRDYVDDY